MPRFCVRPCVRVNCHVCSECQLALCKCELLWIKKNGFAVDLIELGPNSNSWLTSTCPRGLGGFFLTFWFLLALELVARNLYENENRFGIFYSESIACHKTL